MKRPLFNLKRHIYSNVLFSAIPNYKKVKEKLHPDDILEVNASISDFDKKMNLWCVRLEITTKKREPNEARLPYVFSLQSFAFFEPLIQPAEGMDPEEIVRLIFVNGATMMYAAAREYLRMITSSGAYGSLILPTWRFSPEDMKQDGSEEIGKKPKPQKSKTKK